MLSADDIAALKATATAIRETREVEVTFSREGDGIAPLPQRVRLCYLTNRPQRDRSPQAEQITVALLVKGAPDLDVQQGDRFVYNETFYVIDLVRPDRSIETVAEARVLA
jgi:hypothetical protein